MFKIIICTFVVIIYGLNESICQDSSLDPSRYDVEAAPQYESYGVDNGGIGNTEYGNEELNNEVSAYGAPNYEDFNNVGIPNDQSVYNNLANETPNYQDAIDGEIPNEPPIYEDVANQGFANEASNYDNIGNVESNYEDIGNQGGTYEGSYNDDIQSQGYGNEEYQNEIIANEGSQQLEAGIEQSDVEQKDKDESNGFENAMTNSNALSINLPGIGPVPSMSMAGAMSGSMYQQIGGPKNMSEWNDKVDDPDKLLGNAESNVDIGKDGTTMAQTSAGFGGNKVGSSAVADKNSAFGESIAEIEEKDTDNNNTNQGQLGSALSDRSAYDNESTLDATSSQGSDLPSQQWQNENDQPRRGRYGNKMSLNGVQFMPNPKDFREVNFEEHHDKKFNMKAKK